MYLFKILTTLYVCDKKYFTLLLLYKLLLFKILITLCVLQKIQIIF